MKHFRCLYFILGLLITNFTFAQLSDFAKIDYTILPSGNSGIEYSRVRALFNYPIKLKMKGTYVLVGLDYSNIMLGMDGNPSFNSEEIRDFQLLDFNIAYSTPLKNDWRSGQRLTPGFSSNLTVNSLNFEDVIISGDVIFIKYKNESNDVEKP
jgi:hypothetical protein